MSPVGNNDVPYPVSFSSKYVYFMLDNVYVKKNQLDTTAIPVNAEDIYLEFYDNREYFEKLYRMYPNNKKEFETVKMKNFKTLITKKFI